MKTQILFLLAMLLALFAVGCSGNVELSPEEDKKHEEFLKNGIPAEKLGGDPTPGSNNPAVNAPTNSPSK